MSSVSKIVEREGVAYDQSERNTASVQEALDLFGALADGKRLRILKLLDLGELCLCHIIAALELHYGNATLHLKVLKSAGLVRERKIGKALYYKTATSSSGLKSVAGNILLEIRDPETSGDRERLVLFLKSGVNKCDIYLNEVGAPREERKMGLKRYPKVTIIEHPLLNATS